MVRTFDAAAERDVEVTSSSAARVGFIPIESRTRFESGKSSAAQRKKAAEEMSPGTVASMAFSFWPPAIESFAASSPRAAERVRRAPKAFRACSEWSRRVRMASERLVVPASAHAESGRRGLRILYLRAGDWCGEVDGLERAAVGW